MDVRLLWLALGAFAGSVESSLIVVVMPEVAAEVGVSIADAGWLIFVYSLAYGIGTPILATLFGHVDRRTVVAGAEFVFGTMALLFGLLPGYLLLLTARTFLAMGAGMLPLALGFSGDSSFRAPMAWAVIGGLITSTALSLIVIPAAYSVLHDVGLWIARKFRREAKPAEAMSADA